MSSSDFTRRLTWPDEDRPHDWILRYKGKDVGRCYAGHFGTLGRAWLWTIYGSSERGHAKSLAEAEQAFKQAFLRTLDHDSAG